jgi:hypothetical protein
MGRKERIHIQLGTDGEIYEKDEDLVKHATEYYKDLFGPSDSPVFALDLECWGPEEKITDEENNLLTKEFTEEEIKTVVQTMKKIRPWGRTISLLNSIKSTGILLKLI